MPSNKEGVEKLGITDWGKSIHAQGIERIVFATVAKAVEEP